MGEKRIRIIDIADELGLSTATVSNVIHGKTKKISDETVKRVQQLLEEKQYIPSMAGLLLAQNNSRIIGIIVNNHHKYENRVLQDPFINTSIDYLSEEIEEAGYFMMVKATNNCNDIIRYASMWNMEGIIVIGFCEQDYENLRNQMHIPFVVYDGYMGRMERYANIVVDNVDGGCQMGRYLIEQGHKKILCITDNDICMDHERYKGLQKAAAEYKEVKVRQVIVPQEKQERILFYQQHIDFLLEYSAAFAVSDVYAIEFMNFLLDRNIKVPEQMSIAGFDDIPLSNLVRPRLTTVHQDGRVRARMALSMLEQQREHAIFKDEYVLPVTLVVRESVK